MNVDIAALRQDYKRATFDEHDADPDPFAQFERWFTDAREANVPEPTAMTVATVDAGGTPSARIVLLKGFDRQGFVFYTNYESHKGRDLRDNPRVALVFFWPLLERQVRVVGRVERLTREESLAYFHSRPRGSQLGALASEQSAVIVSRAELEERVAALDARYQDVEVPLPDDWGGLRVVPATFEFWQGRSSRLHDRLSYEQTSGDGWRIVRLSP